VERAVVLCRGDHVGIEQLPSHMQPEGRGGSRKLVFAIGTPLREIERTTISETLKHTGGDKRLAARLLGIAARTIYRRLEEERGGAEGDESGSSGGGGEIDGDANGDEPERPERAARRGGV
jgi:two-component system response regulator HydG